MSIQSEDLSVAPFTGAWIEIICDDLTDYVISVAPFTGAWIEIRGEAEKYVQEYVAPFTGAWIEIRWLEYEGEVERSHPSRVRGLKFQKILK